MQIDFECSGGFVPLQLCYRADTEELPSELAEELFALVESSGAFELSPIASSSGGPPDGVTYRLSLTDTRRQKTLTCNDFTAPPALRPLLSRLRSLALKQRRSRS